VTTLGLFAKHPQPGHVKTRLADFLGPERAAGVYAAFVRDLVGRFGGTADRRVLCITPATDDAQTYFQCLASGGCKPSENGCLPSTHSGGLRPPLAGSEPEGHYDLWPQPEIDLGGRMTSFFRDQLRDPTDRVVLIGSDSPTLPREFVEQAFVMLGEADIVLGPATDGGYYLVGMRGRCWPIFDGVEWSRPTVLANTIDRVHQAGATLALLPLWYDVDTEADFHLLRGHVAGLIHAGQANILPATARLLGLDRESATSGL